MSSRGRSARLRKLMTKFFTVREVAEMLDEPVYTARRWLKKERAYRMLGGRVVTTYALLCVSFPEVAAMAMQAAMSEDDE